MYGVSQVTEWDRSSRETRAAGAVLGQLIRDRLRERDWSYGTVARRGELARSTVSYLASAQHLSRPPRPDTLDRLARGLDLPISIVRAAAAEAAGLHYYGEVPGVDRETSYLIASIEELTPADRRHVLALIDSLRNRNSPPSEDPPARG